jgi:hypothetical protein
MVIFIFVVFAGVFIVKAVLSAEKPANSAWQVAASRLGLQYVKGGASGEGSIHGRFEGLRVLVQHVPSREAQGGRGAPPAGNTLFRVMFPQALGAQFRLAPAWAAATTNQSGGFPIVTTGDAAFDAAVVVRARAAEEVLRFLTSGRKAAVRTFFMVPRPAQYIDDKGVVCELQGGADAHAQAVETLRELVYLARQLAAPEEETPEVSQEAPAACPGPDVASVPVAEALAALSAADAASAAEPSAEASASPADGARPAAPVESACAAGLDASAVAAALFDPKHSTYDTRRVFEQAYRGKEVAWHGTLRALEGFSYDAELGSEPGVKATLEIGAVMSALGEPERVCAAVAFAPAARAALAPLRGARVEFRGKLVNVDGVSHTIFVGDGVLAA